MISCVPSFCWYTEVCKLDVHKRGQIGSCSQILNYVRLSDSKDNRLRSYYYQPAHATNLALYQAFPCKKKLKREGLGMSLQPTCKPLYNSTLGFFCTGRQKVNPLTCARPGSGCGAAKISGMPTTGSTSSGEGLGGLPCLFCQCSHTNTLVNFEGKKLLISAEHF